MNNIEDIPHIPDQSQRIQEVTVDCCGQAEELSAFEVYFTDAMQFPFPATWRDPDEPDHAEPITVLGVDSTDDRRGVLLSVKRGDKRRRLLAEQVWAEDAGSIAHLSDVEPEDVAFALCEELDLLDVTEVWDRAGRTRFGYVEPSEVAYEMIEEVLEPYLEELKKYHRLGMNAQANQMCMGLLLGLYRFERESTSEFKDWAPTISGNLDWAVVDAWKEGAPNRADVKAVRDFIEDK